MKKSKKALRAQKESERLIRLAHREAKQMGAAGALVSVVDNEPWGIDDRNWFNANPKRAYRLRSAFMGEPGVKREHVLVKQLQPGARTKLALQAAPELLGLRDLYDDARLDVLFGLVWQGVIEGKHQTLGALLAQSEALMQFVTRQQ